MTLTHPADKLRCWLQLILREFLLRATDSACYNKHVVTVPHPAISDLLLLMLAYGDMVSILGSPDGKVMVEVWCAMSRRRLGGGSAVGEGEVMVGSKRRRHEVGG